MFGDKPVRNSDQIATFAPLSAAKVTWRRWLFAFKRPLFNTNTEKLRSGHRPKHPANP
jgi:hypothetical protein